MKLYLITETLGEHKAKVIDNKKHQNLKSDIYCDLICLVNGKYAQEKEQKAQAEKKPFSNDLKVKFEIIDTEALTIKDYFEFNAHYHNEQFTTTRNGDTTRNYISYSYTKNKKSYHMIVKDGTAEELLNKIHNRNIKEIEFELIETSKDGTKYYREVNYF